MLYLIFDTFTNIYALYTRRINKHLITNTFLVTNNQFFILVIITLVITRTWMQTHVCTVRLSRILKFIRNYVFIKLHVWVNGLQSMSKPCRQLKLIAFIKQFETTHQITCLEFQIPMKLLPIAAPHFDLKTNDQHRSFWSMYEHIT